MLTNRQIMRGLKHGLEATDRIELTVGEYKQLQRDRADLIVALRNVVKPPSMGQGYVTTKRGYERVEVVEARTLLLRLGKGERL